VKRTVRASGNAAPLGPYSHGATDGQVLYTAGQTPVTSEGVVLDEESIAIQTEQALENITRILAEEGLTTDDILKTTVFMTDIDDFDEMNEVYSSFFKSEPPPRSAIEVSRLADDAAIEIEAKASHR